MADCFWPTGVIDCQNIKDSLRPTAGPQSPAHLTSIFERLLPTKVAGSLIRIAVVPIRDEDPPYRS